MPPTYTQKNRPLGVTVTGLGEDKLLLTSFTGNEALSQPFSFHLGMVAEKTTDVPFDKVLGQTIAVRLDLAGGKKRYFHGVCVRLAQGGTDNDFTAYEAEIVPAFRLLAHRAQSRIFQHKNVPDILKEVLKGIDASFDLQGTFDKRDFCVQYRETDFHFASRLMEEEGIYYYFKHSEDGHKMVVANAPQGHADLPASSKLLYESAHGGARPEDRVTKWTKRQELRSGKVVLWDHCFEVPHKHLEAEKETQASVKVGGVDHKLKLGVSDKLELYDWPGAYAQRFDGIDKGGAEQKAEVDKIYVDNKRTAEIRMQQETAPAVVIEAVSGVRQLTSGHKFTLGLLPTDQLGLAMKAEGAYVVLSAAHFATQADYRSERSEFRYHNSFTALPAAMPFRPPRTTPRPFVQGSQTAVVVGPAGEDICTDKYGRVKVQFHWDRQGKNDADSSCWVRVGSIWAGKQWGAIHIPRIGQEVIVDFLEGDPDQPIVVGSVYNAEMMPPYKLPDKKTQSGIKSRSTLKGTADNFNELRFEDKKGSEEVYFHAEKDFNRVVENNDTLKVGFDKHDKGDQTIEIYNNQAVTVGAGKGQADDGSQTVSIWNNQTLTIGSGKGQNKDGSQTVTIWKDRTETIKTGNETMTIEQGNRAVTLKMGNDSLKLSMGNQTTKLDLGASSTEAMQSITLKVGQNSIVIDQTGVTIKGLMITIEGQIQTAVKAAIVQVQGSGMTQIQGGITMIG